MTTEIVASILFALGLIIGAGFGFFLARRYLATNLTKQISRMNLVQLQELTAALQKHFQLEASGKTEI